MALRGIYERPAGNYSARYQSQYQDYDSFYTNPLSPSLLSIPLPLLLLPHLFLFLLLPLSKRFKEVAWVFVELPSPFPPPPLLFARGNHHRVIQDDFHSRSLPKRRSFLSRCFSSVPFFSLSLLLLFSFLFFSFFAPGGEEVFPWVSLSLARRGLEIGLRIKCLKGIADTGKGRETILLRLTWALSFAVRNCVGEIGISAILHSDSLRNGSPMEQMTRINGDWRKRERERHSGKNKNMPVFVGTLLRGSALRPTNFAYGQYFR